MEIRTARAEDADNACMVLRRSIEDLCFADHRGDAEMLQSWLANKTIANVAAWIEAADQRVVVAVEADEVLGVGAGSIKGEILLNYVSPRARFRGVSKAILSSLEEYLRQNDNDVARLTSTQTAHRFYLAMGYRDAGKPQQWHTTASQPMVKAL